MHGARLEKPVLGQLVCLRSGIDGTERFQIKEAAR